MNILIVKTSSMGDVIHTLPAAQAIRKAYPKAHLAWAVERAHAGVLARQPWLDELIVWNRGTLREWGRFIGRLRTRRWNLAIDFQGLFRSGLITWLSGANTRLGYAPTREKAHWFYNQRVPLATMERHAVERYANLAFQAGAEVPQVPLDRPYLEARAPQVSGLGRELFPLHPSVEDWQAIKSWLAKQRFDPARQRLILLNPHCRKAANRWPAARFARLGDALAEDSQNRVALIGGPVARDLCDEIEHKMLWPVWRADGVFSLLGTAALCEHAAVLVTGDTGPMHIAAAVDLPIVALFGPANPLRTGPYSSGAIVLQEPLECAPCYGRTCKLGHEPPLCMDRLNVNRVLHAVQAQLQVREARKRA